MAQQQLPCACVREDGPLIPVSLCVCVCIACGQQGFNKCVEKKHEVCACHGMGRVICKKCDGTGKDFCTIRTLFSTPSSAPLTLALVCCDVLCVCCPVDCAQAKCAVRPGFWRVCRRLTRARAAVPCARSVSSATAPAPTSARHVLPCPCSVPVRRACLLPVDLPLVFSTSPSALSVVCVCCAVAVLSLWAVTHTALWSGGFHEVRLR
jgi:hypothetical protein